MPWQKKKINEQDGAEYGGGGNNQLYQTFIQPFIDVADTVSYGLEKLSVQLQTVVKGFLLGLPTLFVPFLEYDYKTFRNQEAEKVTAVKKKYEKVLQANLDAIMSNDAFGLAFLLAPITALGAQLAIKAPARALGVLNVLSGGAPQLRTLMGPWSGRMSFGFRDPGHHMQNAWHGYGSYGDQFGSDSYAELNESSLIEEPKPGPSKEDLTALLKDKKFLGQIQNGPVAKQMRKDAVDVIVSHVKDFLSKKSYKELRAEAKGDVGFGQIGQQLKMLNQAGKLPPENNTVVANVMVPELKRLYKEFWIQKMQELASQFPEAKQEIAQGVQEIEAL